MRVRTLGYVEEVVAICDFKGVTLAFFVYECNMTSSLVEPLESGLLEACVGIFLLFAWFWRCEIAVVGGWSRREGSARRW